jgi:hypothetical protein
MLVTYRNEGVSLAIVHEKGEKGGDQGFFFPNCSNRCTSKDP